MPSYLNKTAIVTGGASGIGLGITTHLLSLGARVVIADLNVVAGSALVVELNGQFSNDGTAVCAFHETNVASWESQVALLAYAKELYGRIDYFFANAGIAQMREMISSDPTHFGWEGHGPSPPPLSSLASRPPPLSVIRVDLDGVLYSLHAALAYFRAQDRDADGWRGKFVATGSNASIYPFPNDPLYGSAKAGVLGAVRAVGPRVLEEGITVNCFGPSVVATGLAPPAFIQMLEEGQRLTPMKTVTDGVDIFLDPKSKVTGQIIENCAERCVFRAIPPYMDDKARANMNEFYPADKIDAALSLGGLPYTVV